MFHDCYIYMCNIRVGNELGAWHPKTTRFSGVVVVVTCFIISVILAATVMLLKTKLAMLFTRSTVVISVVFTRSWMFLCRIYSMFWKIFSKHMENRNMSNEHRNIWHLTFVGYFVEAIYKLVWINFLLKFEIYQTISLHLYWNIHESWVFYLWKH